MIEVKVLAAILLFLRLIAATFLAFVIVRQIKFLFRKDQELTTVRVVLMTLLGLSFIGQFLPVVIDVSTLLREVNGAPDGLLVAYALSNALTATMLAIGWWVLYKVIEKERLSDEAKHVKSEARHAKTLAQAKKKN